MRDYSSLPENSSFSPFLSHKTLCTGKLLSTIQTLLLQCHKVFWFRNPPSAATLHQAQGFRAEVYPQHQSSNPTTPLNPSTGQMDHLDPGGSHSCGCQHTSLRKHQSIKWVRSQQQEPPKAKKEGFDGDRAVVCSSQKATAKDCNPKKWCSGSMTSSWTYISLSKSGCPGNMTIFVSSAPPCNSFEVKISFSDEDKVSSELWFKVPVWCGLSHPVSESLQSQRKKQLCLHSAFIDAYQFIILHILVFLLPIVVFLLHAIQNNNVTQHCCLVEIQRVWDNDPQNWGTNPELSPSAHSVTYHAKQR